jgi:hypothetical protein
MWGGRRRAAGREHPGSTDHCDEPIRRVRRKQPLRSGERATQRRRRVPRLAADDAAEVALIGEAEIGGQPREGALAAGQALERGADAQPHPVARERVTRGGAEDAAEVMGGDAEIGGKLGERAVRVGGQRLMRGVGEASPFADGGRPAGGDTPGIRLLQRRRGEQEGWDHRPRAT